jgi:Flp pilus assembly protein TadG
MLPVILLLVGGAVDYGKLHAQRSHLQGVADAASLAAAHELHVANTDPNLIKSIAESVVRANMGKEADDVKVEALVSTNPVSVTVNLSQAVEAYIVDQLSEGGIAASATASLRGGSPLCVLGLDEGASGTITLESSARLTGSTCAVYSNSSRSDAIAAKSSAELKADLICSVGGYSGSRDNYEPAPLSDCPKMDDPLAARPAPPISGCTEKDRVIGIEGSAKSWNSKGMQKLNLSAETDNETGGSNKWDMGDEQNPDDYTETHATLTPGTYCGGLTIGGAAQVTLEPGIYVIKDGPLYVDHFAALKGENVGFYFTGSKSTMMLGPNTSIRLTAPAAGSMAGLLFFEEHGSPDGRNFSVLSDDARVLEGTIYLPHGNFHVDADNVIADQSAYTAIIANRLALYAGPHLVLNTDYDQTDIPVPFGGAGKGRTIVLVD